MTNSTSGLNASVLRSFFESQLSSWPLAEENFTHLEGAAVPLATVGMTGWKLEKILACHRRASINAKTDAASIAARPCFLCSDNRPSEQTVLTWRDYEILVNPYPLAPVHFTIASCRHEPQMMSDRRLLDMAEFARAAEGLCIFYNGAKCGASAPDHFHFQAISADRATNLVNMSGTISELYALDGAALYRSTPSTAPFPFFIIESTDDNALLQLFRVIIDTMEKVAGDYLPADSEPPMNIISYALPFDDGTVRLRTMIIPRGKHRPDCYFDSLSPLLVSPATIEMLGTIVCSRKEDFDRIGATTAGKILTEVGLSDPLFNRIVLDIERMLKKHGNI